MKKNFIAISIIIIAAIVGSILVLLDMVHTTKAPSSNPIALGQPCDFRQIASWGDGGTITDTKGLQCYLYDGESSTSLGVWIYPQGMSQPTFIPSDFSPLFAPMTIDWKTYQDAHYSFQYPASWQINQNPDNSVTIIEGNDPSLSFRIDYYPTQFKTTPDYQILSSIPDDLMSYQIGPWDNNNVGEFDLVRSFTLNGLQAMMLEEMQTVAAGGMPLTVVTYIYNDNSYLTATYARYNEPNLDLPVEMVIDSLKLNAN